MKVVSINKFRLMLTLILFISIIPRKFTNFIFLLIFFLSILEILPLIISRKISIKDINGKIYLSIILISIYAIFNFIINSMSIYSLERLFQLLLCFIVLLSCTNHQWNKFDIRYLKSNIYFLVLIMIFFKLLNGSLNENLFTNRNAMGGTLMSVIPLIFLCNKKMKPIDILFLIIVIVFLIISDNRSVWISILIFFCGLYIFPKFNQKGINYKAIFIIMLIICISIPQLYVLLWNSSVRTTLNELSYKYFNKNFFSGRQLIWSQLLPYIYQRKWIGYGFSVTLSMFFEETRSAHNWYLQTILQMGIIGMIIICYLLKKIWDVLYQFKSKNVITLAFMLGILVWQSFEVTLTQNNLPTGIIVWMILGFGLSEYSRNNTIDDKQVKCNEK